ncbi:MAG TPA: helix-turn-helix transcriptional regulator [Microlunatus sp.]
MSSNELGLFLRSRRNSVTPAQVGLPGGARRRTPGLRRAELATLAGVSVEYVTRLEQGRDQHPSAQVLAALADALQLSSPERVHLLQLSKMAGAGFTCTAPGAPTDEVRPSVRAVVEQLEPAPAALFSRTDQVIAHTPTYRRLMEPLGLFDGVPNLAGFVFTDPRAHQVFPDWSQQADEAVATLKRGPFRSDPAIAALVDELTVAAGADFTDRLETVPGLPPVIGITRVQHPDLGELRLSHETLEISHDPGLRLIVQLPADPHTAAALDQLAGRRPGALRAVAG